MPQKAWGWRLEKVIRYSQPSWKLPFRGNRIKIRKEINTKGAYEPLEGENRIDYAVCMHPVKGQFSMFDGSCGPQHHNTCVCKAPNMGWASWAIDGSLCGHSGREDLSDSDECSGPALDPGIPILYRHLMALCRRAQRSTQDQKTW